MRVDHEEVRSLEQFNRRLAEAIRDLDDEAIQDLKGIAEGWLELESEKAAQRELLEAIEGVVCIAAEQDLAHY